MFDARIASRRQTSSARRKTSSFTAASSTTASIIRSAGTSSLDGVTRASVSSGSAPPLAASLTRLRVHRLARALGRARERVVQRDAPARGGHDLGDPAAHLACADDQYVLDLHRRRTLPFAHGRGTATPDDAEAIERIRVRGWQVGYRHLYPPELARRARARLDALGAADRAPAVRLGHVRRRGARAHRRLRLARPEPRRARGRRAVRDLRRPRRVVARRRSRADRARRGARSPSSTRRRRSGCWRTTRGRAASTRRRAGVRTARASGSSASASHRPRCDTGSASPFLA